MTKYLILSVLVVAIVFAVESYANKFDNIQVERVFRNNRLVTNYIRCILDIGPCSKDGHTLKKVIKDITATNCIRCTQRQKNVIAEVINQLKTKRPEDWQRILDKYAPESEQRQNLERLSRRD